MMSFYYGEDCSDDSDSYDGIARGNFKYFLEVKIIMLLKTLTFIRMLL